MRELLPGIFNMPYKFLCNISKAGLSLTKIWYLWGWAIVGIRAANIGSNCHQMFGKTINIQQWIWLSVCQVEDDLWKSFQVQQKPSRDFSVHWMHWPSRNPGDGPTALLSNAFYCLESPSCLVPTKEINRIRWRVIVEFFLVFWNDCWFGQDFMHVSLPPIQNAGPSWG